MDGEKNVFAALSAINVNDKTEKKNGLTYLSWAWAWGEVKKRYPEAAYTIYENREGWCYHTDGRTCWVKTGVTIGGQECIEYLPVMDHRNRSIPLESVTSFDVNKAIQRSLTKAIARHGLGFTSMPGRTCRRKRSRRAARGPHPGGNPTPPCPAASPSARYAENEFWQWADIRRSRSRRAAKRRLERRCA